MAVQGEEERGKIFIGGRQPNGQLINMNGSSTLQVISREALNGELVAALK